MARSEQFREADHDSLWVRELELAFSPFGVPSVLAALRHARRAYPELVSETDTSPARA
jgi:hypothetical protein